MRNDSGRAATNPTGESPDASLTRERERLAWARAALASTALELTRASTDAGFRSYWRSSGASPERIVMDSPPGKEDVRPWLTVRDLLASGGVRVPVVLARDNAAGFLLLEDLGAATCLDLIDNANADALFDAAIAQLLKLQAIAPPAGFARYDEALLARELQLFDHWFLGRHLGLTLEGEDLKQLQLSYERLIEAALAQPQVLVHRDYMLRNLMPMGSAQRQGSASVEVAVLDFQDAVYGPIAYDPICLFKDAFVSWPTARIEAWLDDYHVRALIAGIPVPERARFGRDTDWIGVQRHLKVIGIFARLHHRDGKSKYLADVPRFFGYLDEVLPRYPELAPLQDLIQRKVKPAIAEASGIRTQ